MKKQFVFLTLLTSLVIYSCSKEKTTASAMPGYNLTPKTYPVVTLNENGVGEWHNYYVDLIYSQMSNDITLEGLSNYTWQDARTSTYAITDNIFTGDYASTYNGKAHDIFNLITESEDLADCNASLEAVITSYSGIPSSVKNTFITFWSDCESITTITDANNKANWLKTQANSFSGVYKQIAIGSADVYQASFAYWYNNMDDWKTLYGDNSSTPASSYTSVAGADGKGFAVGAFYGSVGGTATLPGIGTFSGWLGGGLVGGLTGSVGTMISNIFDFFFG